MVEGSTYANVECKTGSHELRLGAGDVTAELKGHANHTELHVNSLLHS
jgi:hypothetical protein